MELALEGTVNERHVRILLDKEQCRIGRSREAEIWLDHATVSRLHAAVQVLEDHIVVKDLGSHNGTFLNGTKVTAPVTVRPRDEIQLGGIKLKLLPLASDRVGIQELDSALLPDGSVQTLQEIRITPWPEMTSTASMDLTNATMVQQTMMTSMLKSRPGGGGGAYERLLDYWDKGKGSGPTVAPDLAAALPHMMNFQTVDDTVRTLPDWMRSTVRPRTLALFLRESEEEGIHLKAVWPPRAFRHRRALLTPALLQDVAEGFTSRLLGNQTKHADGAGEGVTDERAFVAPLRYQDRSLGVLYLGTDEAGLTAADQARASHEAFHSAATLYAMKMVQSFEFERRLREEGQLRREKDRMSDAMAVAAKIQRKLLPETLPEIPGYELFTELQASLETAGDLYDVLSLSGSATGVLVGDASGKGVGASLLMANVLASIRMSLTDTSSLIAIVERLNTLLERSTEPDHFVTLFLARLDHESHTLEYVNAGHNPPFLLAPGREPLRLTTTGIPAGMIPGSTYTCERVPFPPGALLCLYTDGLTEAGAGSEEYGDERLLQYLSRVVAEPVSRTGPALLQDLEAFLNGRSLHDDMTIVLVRRSG
ncbi:MAG TPA: SpoIIE family protein phosphatase [Candidatus Eisenbacteria bacterium]|nr:SpoIIE family protein phosphatase [Candidatus Eisenbacteria bacterium]